MNKQQRPISALPSFKVRRAVQKATHSRARRNAFIITFIIHLIGAYFLIQYIRDPIVEEDAIFIDWVELPQPKRALAKPKRVEALSVEPTTPGEGFRAASTTARLPAMPTELETADIANITVAQPRGTLTHGNTETRSLRESGGGVASGGGAIPGDKSLRPGSRVSRFDSLRRRSAASERTAPTAVEHDLSTRVAADVLGGVLEGTAQEPTGHIRIIRLKHGLSDWWQDPTAIPSFAKWLQENTQLRVDMTYAGGSLPLTDDRILNAPMVIMTGHDKDVHVGRNLDRDGQESDGFTKSERAQLRKYIIEGGGLLFFDDCGFNGLFAAQVQNELRLTFPEYPLTSIPHTHELYTIYYQLPRPPSGGDVFWKSENKAKPSKYKYQKGITINRRLAVVFNRKDYLCAMETAEISSRTMLRMRRSHDVHRFMTNLLIYQMRYGGNTDRSQFKR